MGIKGYLIIIGLTIAQIFVAILPGEPIELLAGMCYGGIGGTIFITVTAPEVKSTTYVIRYTKEDVDYEFDYSYKGDYEKFIAPYTGTYKMELWGASGGNPTSDQYPLGAGAYTSGEINLTKDQELYVYVGSMSTSATGGYNGGGNGYGYENYGMGYGGGGATDIRVVSGNWNDAESLRSRIMVAAGGGGLSYYNNDGYLIGLHGEGGTLNGKDGDYFVRSRSASTWYLDPTPAKGGTQTSGGMGGKINGSAQYGQSGGFGFQVQRRHPIYTSIWLGVNRREHKQRSGSFQ